MKVHHASGDVNHWCPTDVSGSPLGNSPPLSVLVSPQQVVTQCYWRYWCPGILEFRWRWQWWGWPKWACCVRNIEEAYSARSFVVSFERSISLLLDLFTQVMIVNIPYSIRIHTYPKVLSTTKNIIISPQLHTRPNLSILHKPISFLPSSHSALES